MAYGSVGRPSKFSPRLAQEICRRLAEGTPFSSVCRDDDMPHFSSIWRWERAHPEFRAQIQEALEAGSNFLAHDCIRIADDAEMDVASRRLMVDTRLKLISKWHRRIYGDRVAVEATTTTVQDLTDEELEAAIKQQFRSLAAQGIDVRAMVDDLS